MATLLIVTGCATLSPPEEHTTLGQRPEAPEVPASVTSVDWDWQPPEDTGITHVSPTQYGVTVAIGDGVVALAGDTGEEHWHYRRPEEPITSAAVTPDGSKVMVSYAGDHTDEEVEDDSPAENEIVLLDSATGNIISQHTTQFDSHSVDGLDGNVHRESEHEPGIITDEARVIQESDDGEHGDIVAHTLENGEELWRFSPETEQGPENAETFLSHGFVAQKTLVLALLFTDQEEEGVASTDNPRDYTFTLIGLDTEDGSEMWKKETSGENQVDYPLSSTARDQEGHNIFAFNEFTDHEEEWVLNSGSGEPVTDVNFISRREQSVVGAVDNQIVTARDGDDEDEIQYAYEELSGDTRDSFSVDAPVARRVHNTFIVPLADDLAWLDVNQPEDYSWGPAQLVVTAKSNEHSETLDLGGLVVEEDSGHDGTSSHSTFPDPEAMTLAPGSLVVQGERDDDGSPRTHWSASSPDPNTGKRVRGRPLGDSDVAAHAVYPPGTMRSARSSLGRICPERISSA